MSEKSVASATMLSIGGLRGTRTGLRVGHWVELRTKNRAGLPHLTGVQGQNANLGEDAKNRRFAAILVESQDRLWRDQGEMHYALKRLRFWGIRVIAVGTGADLTDRTGRLLASVMGWKDEAFLDDLRDKTRRGMAGQVRRGLSAGGRAFGYCSEPTYNEQRQIAGYKRVINGQEAAIVRRIFELYDAGYSPKTIVHMLNKEGVTPPRPSRGRRLMGWTWTTINGSPKKGIGILNNPLYVGRVAWNRSQKYVIRIRENGLCACARKTSGSGPPYLNFG